jgi:anti-sigma factor RsiW
MEITPNVILDLLPLYVADEVSADTRALVEEYLETDPELADMAQDWAKREFPGDIPVPLTKEDAMEAYREARRLMFLRTVILGITIAITVACVFGMGLMAVFWYGALRLTT